MNWNFIDLEIYKDVYIPSKDGRIYSKYSNKYLKPYIRKDLYQSVSLVHPITREKATINVHRYIAYFLVDGYGLGKVVNHIDGNPSNNHTSNLEWVTQKENIAHATEVLGTRDYRDERHPMYSKKHSEESKLKMSKSRAKITGKKHWKSKPVKATHIATGDTITFESMNMAANDLSISQGNISMVLSGKRNQTGGYKWEYIG